MVPEKAWLKSPSWQSPNCVRLRPPRSRKMREKVSPCATKRSKSLMRRCAKRWVEVSGMEHEEYFQETMTLKKQMKILDQKLRNSSPCIIGNTDFGHSDARTNFPQLKTMIYSSSSLISHLQTNGIIIRALLVVPPQMCAFVPI